MIAFIFAIPFKLKTKQMYMIKLSDIPYVYFHYFNAKL